jgi:hypothetical protein
MNADYAVDESRIAYREDGYHEFWGREPDLILHQTDEAVPHIDTYRFPKADSGIAGDCIVYLTGGMSDLPQPGTEEYDQEFQRVELSTYASEIVMTDSGKTDFLGWILGWMAHYPFEQDTYFLHGQTFDWGKPLTPNSEMHGFYFADIPFVDESELCRQSGTARSILHLVTLSKAELDFRLEHGTEMLLELLERHRVPPFFDLQRRCTIKGEQDVPPNA